MGLQSIERTLERMVESVFSRSSRRGLRPVELGRRLLRHMDEHRSVDVKGRRLVPNAFTYYLSPTDHASFADIDLALRHELAEAASEYAREEGFGMVGPVSIAFEVDQSLKPGRFGIFSHMREAPLKVPPSPALQAAIDSMPPKVDPPMPPAVRPAQAAQPAQPAAGESVVHAAPADLAAAPVPPVPELADIPDLTIAPAAGLPIEALVAPEPRPGVHAWVVLPGGDRVPVVDRVVSFGRLPDCTVTLNDPNVSRHHAEIRPGAAVVLVDLGSTNGTLVNGVRITEPHPLLDGDVISMGQSHIRFEAP